jgi:outer membrane protein
MKYLIAFSIFIFSMLALAETKIAVIDMEKAVQGTSAGKKAKAELENDFKKHQSEFQKKEEDLKKMADDLEKKKSVLSEDAIKTKQAEFQQEILKYRDEVSKEQIGLQKRQRELETPIVEKIKSITTKIAKDKSYSMVMEKSQGILYFTAQDDVTDEVIKAFDKKD